MRISVHTLILASIVFVGTFTPRFAQQLPVSNAPCDVTSPNGIVAGQTGIAPSQTEWQHGSYGNALLSVGPFGLWPDGTVIFTPGGAGFVTSEGGLGMKFGWTKVAGKLRVTGRRLDGDAAPLSFSTHENRGPGFQASHVIFSTPGCWEVTAQLAEREDSKLAFVTKVVKIGDGPGRYDPPKETIQVWPQH
jgi:hypothetical protein